MGIHLERWGLVAKVNISPREQALYRRLDRVLARRRKRLRKRMDAAIAEVFGPRPIHSEDCT